MNQTQKTGFHYGFVIVACCCLMMGINVGLAFSCAGIFYTPVSESLGVPVGDFGVYMSVLYVASALFLPTAGNMLRRYNGRWLFTGAAAVMGLTFIGMSMATALWHFYLAGAVLGLTLAFLMYLGFSTLVNAWFSKHVGLMVGIACSAAGLGGVIFNPIGASLITAYGWRVAYMVFAGIVLVVETPLLGVLLRDTPADKGLLPYGANEVSGNGNSAVSTAEGVEYERALRMPALYALIGFAFLMMGCSTLNLFIPTFVKSNNFSAEQGALVAAAVMAGVTVGKMSLGWINDHNSVAGVLVTCGGGALGLALIVVPGAPLWLLFAGAFLFGWQYAGVMVQTAMLTRKVFGSKDYGRIYAIVSVALSAGGAIAAAGWGLLADSTSYTVSMTVGAVALVVCAMIGLLVLRASANAAPRRAAAC